MFEKIVKFIGGFIKWGSFLFITFIAWYVLTIFNPHMRYLIIIFVVIYLILNFPKGLFSSIIEYAILLKSTINKNNKTINEQEEEALSPVEEFLYKGSIIISIVFFCLIIYYYFHNKHLEKQLALYQTEKLDMNITMTPIQINNPNKEAFTLTINNTIYNLKPLAKYKIAGVVVAKNTFMIFDALKDLSPVDIGLVWGELAKPTNYKRMEFYSNFRIMPMASPPNFEFDNYFITTHSSHNHIIPANDTVKNIVMDLNIDDKVIFEGYLVEVTNEKIRPWKSSLKRDDHLFNSGAGCEILYLEKVTKIYN